MEEKKFNVDEALIKLEEINKKLASSDIELDESLELYKEGVVLAKACHDHLEGVEKKLKVINEEEV